MSAASGAPRGIALDDFCRRQWKDDYKGLIVKGMSQEALEAKVNEIYNSDPSAMVEGYAPFCKHLFVKNFLQGAHVEAVPITPENRQMLESDYVARKEGELAVLTRWFPEGSVQAPPAEWLDLIFYSREQIRKENAAMGKPEQKENAPWGLISIKAQSVPYEIPMQPITMLRNALGREEGGSGVPLDKDKYAKSVEFWAAHAVVS